MEFFFLIFLFCVRSIKECIYVYLSMQIQKKIFMIEIQAGSLRVKTLETNPQVRVEPGMKWPSSRQLMMFVRLVTKASHVTPGAFFEDNTWVKTDIPLGLVSLLTDMKMT